MGGGKRQFGIPAETNREHPSRAVPRPAQGDGKFVRHPSGVTTAVTATATATTTATTAATAAAEATAVAVAAATTTMMEK